MEIDPRNLHHAYLILGDRALGEVLLISLLDKIGLREQGNPDFHAYRTESLDVDTAREISLRSIEKPFGEKKIFLISAERFTPQAQNALLKTIEEPAANLHFFILAREEGLLLPTLLSRVQIVRQEKNYPPQSEDSFSPKSFLGLSIKKRLNFAKDFADKEKSLPTFLDSLLIYMRERKSDMKTIDKVFRLRRFASDPAVSSRLILEHLSLVLE